MESLYQLLGLIGAGLIIWILYRAIKGQPALFQKEAMSKSFMSMGVVALLLICFVGVLVLMLRA